MAAKVANEPLFDLGCIQKFPSGKECICSVDEGIAEGPVSFIRPIFPANLQLIDPCFSQRRRMQSPERRFSHRMVRAINV
jgi:hypothetical protein